MDSKTLQVLEYPKILERLAANCDFSASAALARSLEPTTSYDTALLRPEMLEREDDILKALAHVSFFSGFCRGGNM